jgi:hypothetical protein
MKAKNASNLTRYIIICVVKARKEQSIISGKSYQRTRKRVLSSFSISSNSNGVPDFEPDNVWISITEYIFNDFPSVYINLNNAVFEHPEQIIKKLFNSKSRNILFFIIALSVKGDRPSFMSEFLQWEEKLIKIIIDDSRGLNKIFIIIFVVSDNNEDLINSEIRVPKVQRI